MSFDIKYCTPPRIVTVTMTEKCANFLKYALDRQRDFYPSDGNAYKAITSMINSIQGTMSDWEVDDLMSKDIVK